MKNIKRYFICLTVVILAFSLCGCDLLDALSNTATPSCGNALLPTAPITQSAEPTEANGVSPTDSAEALAPEITLTPTANPTQAEQNPPVTEKPTKAPTAAPTEEITAEPTKASTAKPTVTVTAKPTVTVTAKPTVTVTTKPTVKPTETPAPTVTAVTMPPGAAPYCRTNLSRNMQTAYDKVVEAMSAPDFKNGNMTVVIDMPIETDYSSDASRLVHAILADHPEFFFLGNRWSLSYSKTTIFSLTFESAYTNQQIKTAQTAIAEGVKYYTDKISPSLSQYEIALRLYELIASKVTYTLEGSDLHNIAGALINNAGVCESFAESYQYILNMYGIQAFTVTGKATNSSGQTENHMWVAAKIDGSWYFIDPTWADLKSAAPITSGHTRVSYAYFCLTSAQIGISHVLDPQSELNVGGIRFNSTASNYHVKEGGYFEQYDQSLIASYIKKQIPQAYAESREIVSLRFASKADYNAALDYLVKNIVSIYNSIPNKPSVKLAYFASDTTLVVDVWLKY